MPSRVAGWLVFLLVSPFPAIGARNALPSGCPPPPPSSLHTDRAGILMGKCVGPVEKLEADFRFCSKILSGASKLARRKAQGQAAAPEQAADLPYTLLPYTLLPYTLLPYTLHPYTLLPYAPPIPQYSPASAPQLLTAALCLCCLPLLRGVVNIWNLTVASR
jgi:hypothetical protein